MNTHHIDLETLWTLPTTDLRHALLALAATTATPAPDYYNALREMAVRLVLDAPDPEYGPGHNPPHSSAEFMNRFDTAWLWRAWGGEHDADDQVVLPVGAPHERELLAIAAAESGKWSVLTAERSRYQAIFRWLAARDNAPEPEGADPA
ncbi:MAG: hypothetical protein HOQ24_12150 [Mycobacteriaceae bacterium]|nr:hypothetical protein [Mycobacteriaceae bacterium]